MAEVVQTQSNNAMCPPNLVRFFSSKFRQAGKNVYLPATTVKHFHGQDIKPVNGT